MPVRLLSYFAYSGCRGLTANRRGLFHCARFATVFPTDVLYGPSSFTSVESVFAIFGYALGRLLLSMSCFFPSLPPPLHRVCRWEFIRFSFFFFPGEPIVDGVRVDAAFFELFFHDSPSIRLLYESFIRRAIFLSYFHFARLSLSLNFLSSIYIRVCLFLSLSLILLVISRLVCFSKTVDIVFFCQQSSTLEV